MKTHGEYFNRAEAARYLCIEPHELDQYMEFWMMKYHRIGKRKLFTLAELQRFANLPGNHQQVEYDSYGLIRPKKHGIVIELYPDGITGFEQKPLKSTVR